MRDVEKKAQLYNTSLTSNNSSFIPPLSALVPYSSSLVPQLSVLVLVWSITAVLTLAFVSLIVIAPIALAGGHHFAALVFYKSFEKFCNQIPERSFYVDGHPFAVCARCTGIYFGFAAGVLIYPLVRSLKNTYPPLARKWLLFAAVPLLLDFGLDYLGVLRNTLFTRSVTGALMGSVVAFYVVPALLDMTRIMSASSDERHWKQRCDG